MTLKLAREVSSFPSKLIAVITTASTVHDAVSVRFFGPDVDGSTVKEEEKACGWLAGVHEDRRVVCGPWPSCVDSADPVPEFSSRCPSAIVRVWAFVS